MRRLGRAASRALRAGWRDLRFRPGQSLLTAASLVIGILAVCVIVAVSTVAKDSVVASEEQEHGRAPTVAAQADPSILFNADMPQLLDVYGRRLRDVQHAEIVSTLAVAAGSRGTSILTLRAVSGDLHGVRRLPVVRGRWFADGDDLPSVLVLNQVAWNDLADVRSWHIHGQRQIISTHVVGVVADGSQDPVAYIPMATFVRLVPTKPDDLSLTLLAHAQGVPEAALDQGVNLAGRDAHFTITEQAARADRVDERVGDLDLMTRIFVICAAVALLVAALGILNIGLSSIKERSRELVVRRAMGAKRSDLVGMVMVTSVVLALGASAVAILLGAIVVHGGASQIVPAASAVQSPQFPLSAGLVGAACALVTALLGSLAPAVVAARLQVADALRG